MRHTHKHAKPSPWRWLATLPPAAGLVITCILASWPAVATAASTTPNLSAYTSFAITRTQAQQPQAPTVSLAQVDAALRVKVARIEARRERARDHRQEARKDARQAAAALAAQQAAARAAARQARRAAAASAQASLPASSTGTPGSFGAPPGSYQACVIMAESGGNPTIVNPTSGAGGLYQFLLSTWLGLGLGYPGGAQTAPPSVQTQGFFKLYAEAGPAPWSSDGC